MTRSTQLYLEYHLVTRMHANITAISALLYHWRTFTPDDCLLGVGAQAYELKTTPLLLSAVQVVSGEYVDIGRGAVWAVSSVKQGFSVKALYDGKETTFWQCVFFFFRTVFSSPFFAVALSVLRVPALQLSLWELYIDSAPLCVGCPV
jgi:anaphase-promoting complex subunit 10 (APC10)